MNGQLVVSFLLFCCSSAKFPQRRSCKNTEFECHSGECIPKMLWCNSTHNNIHVLYYPRECKDNSNREYCYRNSYSCPKNQTKCLYNKRCIPEKWICDGYTDCSDGSDERECLYGGFRIRDVPGSASIKQGATSWLLSKRRLNWGWEEDSARATVALYFSNNSQFESRNKKGMLMLKQLKVHISELLLRNAVLPVHKLAHYVHSLLATCQDPRNFMGKNLIKELQERFKASGPVNPFATLALCNSNSSLAFSSIEGLMEIMKKPIKPETVDLQAYAAMTFNCLRKRNSISLETFYANSPSQKTTITYRNNTNVEEFFKALQKEDGSFGSFYTTAVVMQALLSDENFNNHSWDMYKAYKYIFEQQKSDGSFGNMMNTYLVIPLLHFRTLVDLGNADCTQDHKELRNLTVKEELESQLVPKIKVEYSIWLGENKDISFLISMNVPINTTFYDVMRLAAELDSKYSFQYVHYQKGKYVVSIFGTSNDPEARTYWRLYRTNKHGMVFAGEYPDKVTPKDGDIFTYWYKNHGSMYHHQQVES